MKTLEISRLSRRQKLMAAGAFGGAALFGVGGCVAASAGSVPGEGTQASSAPASLGASQTPGSERPSPSPTTILTHQSSSFESPADAATAVKTLFAGNKAFSVLGSSAAKLVEHAASEPQPTTGPAVIEDTGGQYTLEDGHTVTVDFVPGAGHETISAQETDTQGSIVRDVEISLTGNVHSSTLQISASQDSGVEDLYATDSYGDEAEFCETHAPDTTDCSSATGKDIAKDGNQLVQDISATFDYWTGNGAGGDLPPIHVPDNLQQLGLNP